MNVRQSIGVVFAIINVLLLTSCSKGVDEDDWETAWRSQDTNGIARLLQKGQRVPDKVDGMPLILWLVSRDSIPTLSVLKNAGVELNALTNEHGNLIANALITCWNPPVAEWAVKNEVSVSFAHPGGRSPAYLLFISGRYRAAIDAISSGFERERLFSERERMLISSEVNSELFAGTADEKGKLLQLLGERQQPGGVGP